MSERSVGRTAVPEIADRAGVAAGTIYRHFESKEALVNALYRACKAELAAHLDRAVEGADGPRDLVSRLWRGLYAYWREQPQALRFLEMHRHQPYLDAASRELAGDVFRRVVVLLERAQAQGGLRCDPPELLIALAFGAFVGWVKEAEAGHVRMDDVALEVSQRAVWALLAG
jgi:AcrR family transcriptional regulator